MLPNSTQSAMKNSAPYGRDLDGQPLTLKQRMLFDALDRREWRRKQEMQRRSKRIEALTQELARKKTLPHIGLPIRERKPLPDRPKKSKPYDPGPQWRINNRDRREKAAIARKERQKHMIITYSITPETRRLNQNVRYILWEKRMADKQRNRTATPLAAETVTDL